jgi:hypothetical protein
MMMMRMMRMRTLVLMMMVRFSSSFLLAFLSSPRLLFSYRVLLVMIDGAQWLTEQKT